MKPAIVTTPAAEEWRPVKGYEGLYEVSNLGRVKSLARSWTQYFPGIGVTGLYHHKERFLKGINMNGYKYVSLSKDGALKQLLLHRIVATAFLPNPDNHPCVNHKDENKQNNSVENLEWCTHEYNDNYGTRNRRIYIGNTKNRKPVGKYDKSGVLIATYESVNEAAKQNGINAKNISSNINGKSKSTSGYIYKVLPSTTKKAIELVEKGETPKIPQ